MEMRILFLDDNPERHRVFKQRTIGCTVDSVFNADTCLEFLRKSGTEYDVIFLDHDLDATLENKIVEGEKDGRYVVRKMIEEGITEGLVYTKIVIHSLNRPAAERMEAALKGAGIKEAKAIPFAWTTFTFDRHSKEISFPKAEVKSVR